jgi:putative ATP-dependent endonuclease of OLD family
LLRNAGSSGILSRRQRHGTCPIAAGHIFTYVIRNGSLDEPSDPAAKLYRDYLSSFEINTRLRDEFTLSPLATPVLSLPVNRAAGGFQSSISLASYNEFDLKKQVDAATSRTGASLVALAVGRIAQKYRLMLETHSATIQEDFYSDPALKGLTEILKGLGYDWELATINPL